MHLAETLLCLGIKIVGKQFFNIAQAANVHLANLIGLLVGAGLQLNQKLIVHFKQRHQIARAVYCFYYSHCRVWKPLLSQG